MRDRDRVKRYADAMGDDAVRRQTDATKVYRKCCGTLKAEPHAPDCRTGKRAERRRS